MQALLWFYLRGKGPETGERKAAARAYDFEQDAGRIYAAFLAIYGMDLTQVDYLHWWAFMALLEALPDTTQMGQIMAWRTMDLDGIKDKATRAHYAELKRRYAVQRKGRCCLPVRRGSRRKSSRPGRREGLKMQKMQPCVKQGCIGDYRPRSCFFLASNSSWVMIPSSRSALNFRISVAGSATGARGSAGAGCCLPKSSRRVLTSWAESNTNCHVLPG